MTDKPIPTDAELKAMWQLHAADIGGIFSYARAVLAKWGQPAQAAEPFCWHWESTFNGGTGTVKKNPETLGINMSHPDYKWTALYTAPKPVAWAPLTNEQIQDLLLCGNPTDEEMRLIRIGWDAAHGIKGGRSRYFTRCDGIAAQSTTTWQESCGKNCTRPVEVSGGRP